MLSLLSIGPALVAGPAYAAEYTTTDEPVPESVSELDGPLRRSFEEREREAPLFPRVKKWLEPYPEFIRDTQIDFNPRMYYFWRDNGDRTKSEAWTIGGSLAYRSGWLKDTLRIGAELFTSQKIEAPGDRDGTQLLKPGQEGYTVLGTAYANLRWRSILGTVYRQYVDFPYVNGNDSRMTPNTFEGGLIDRKTGRARFSIGHLTRIKLRNDDDFIHISKAAGLQKATHDGLTLAGGAWTPNEWIAVGALNYMLWDVYNTLYMEGDWVPPLTFRGGDIEFRLGFQATDQRSTGSEKLGSFETWMVGAKALLGYKGAIFGAAFNSVGNDRAVQTPFGGYPGYLSSMLADFRRADEDSWGFWLSYNFGSRGFKALGGLSFFGRIARGENARDPDELTSLPDRNAYDITFDYRFKKGWMRGVWLRVRYAYLEQEGAGDRSNVRVILRWELPAI
jgi:hypothetical protein